MAITIYHYPKCSTCRNALKWLAGRRVEATLIDVVAAPPSARTLARLHRSSGLPLVRFFNTSGESYRAGNYKERLKTMSNAEAYQALATDGKLIKRPLVDTGRTALVGFDAAAWAKALKA